MSPSVQHKPIIHGRDHCPGGADPIPCLTAGGAGTFETVVEGIPNLFAYWRLGETSSPLADTSGAGTPADLAENGAGTAPTYSVEGALPASQDDGALEFNYNGTVDGGGRYLRASGKNFDTVGGNMTAAVWVNVKASATTKRGHILGTSNISGSTHQKIGWGFQVMYPSRVVRFTLGGSPEVYAETPAGVVAGEWNLFVATYDGATIRLYANGIPVDDTPIVGGATTTDHSIWAGGAYVDYVAFSEVFGYLYGSIDEAAIWSRALTPEEVASLTAGGTGTSGPGELADGSVFDRHVNAAADIQPTKLQHPGGTTTFLRADGTWAAPPSGGAAPTDTAAWMPLTTVVSSVPELVWDANNSLIPTLTPT